MLIKFTTGGRGGGGTVAAYLLDHEREGREAAAPEVLRGDMVRTAELIDSIARNWTYTHGVLSFAPEDAPTDEQQRAAMDQFEAFAFAGLDPEQYDITWVRHQHTSGGRVELHFVTPRMELTSGRALNIAPPGWERSFSKLRDALNLTHGWARPDDPARARDLGFEKPVEWQRDGFRIKEGREAVHAYVTALVERGTVRDRHSMVQALMEAGLGVTRQGKDYLTVQDAETGDRLRLKGRIYEKDWSYEQELGRAATREAGEPDERDRVLDRQRAEEAVSACSVERDRRAERHQNHYPATHQRDSGRSAAAEVDRVRDMGGTDRELDPDQLLALAIDTAPSAANSPRTVRDLPERGAELSADPERSPARRMPGQQRSQEAVSAPADGELTDGPAHDFRTQFARTVQEIGQRIRSVTERVRGAVREAGRLVASYLETAKRDRDAAATDREHSAAADRSLGDAERLNVELGRAGEQALKRAQELEHAHRRERDRVWDYGL
ncbi:relaxase/mobilization nuclease domain-containing protein [Ponticaulis profundi]|uniref:Relaxase/mobilization nuclease domain-containing protein n=1 Tax=Ponticaulis profundi TaxID=2665222 RepID=A0ABW1S7V2_9PROT